MKSKKSLLILSALCAQGLSAAAEEPKSLTEFSASENERLGWNIVNDGVMGGRSKGKVTFSNDGVMRFEGTLSLENNGGFSTVRTSNGSADLGDYSGISMRVKGDGRTYQFRLGTDAKYRFMEVSFMADFKTEKGKWTEVQIPFDNFVGSFRGRTLKDEVLDPAKVRRFGLLLADKKSGPFEIDVDWIRAYPEGSTPKSATKGTDLAALLAGDERFKTLVAAASAADLVGVLQGEDNLTVFAPTNEAFAALPKGKVAELLKPENKETLQAILKYHVVGGSNNVAAVLSGKELGTVQGGKVTVGFDEGRVRVNGAAVTDGDLKASNGIVHVIDKVLIPDLPKPKKSTTILGTAEAAGDFKKLAGLVKLAGLTSALEEEGPFTVLAPTDSAFSKLSKETVASLLKKENRGKLQSILKYHVIPGRVTAGDLLNGKSAKTLLGAEVKVQLKDGSLMAGDAKVLTADLECDNGLIHVIDGVLIPSEGSNRTADAEGSQSPADLLNAAIEKGVPIYNGGDHAECAAIYRKCLKELSVDERVSEKTRGMIAQVLDKASSLDSKNAQAWMLRRLMDGLLDRYES